MYVMFCAIDVCTEALSLSLSLSLCVCVCVCVCAIHPQKA